MSLLTFRGGIHPYEGKELTKDKPVQDILPSKEMVYPLSQHIGAPAIPIVAISDIIQCGQKIAEASGFVSVPIYATVSGKVTKIEKRLLPNGSESESIIVENDEEYTEVAYDQPIDFMKMTREEIVERIKDAGIVGMGGAGFPTHVKLSPKDPAKIEYVIANCSECEPYLTSDYRRMLESPEKIIGGMKVILSLFQNAKGILAIEDNKMDCVISLEKLLKSEKNIEVKVLKTKYPQGSERQLIYASTGRAIHSGMLPADAGCIVNNVDTICAIQNAIENGKPLTKRIVTVTGDAVKNPGNYQVSLGTDYKTIIDAAGGFIINPEKVVSGGPMMGISLFDLHVPTIKTSSAILCMSKDEVSKWEPSACINCGMCMDVCPGRVVPTRLAKFADVGNREEFEKWNGMECCECGCCSFICPAKRRLTQSIKTMRRQILSDKNKKKK